MKFHATVSVSFLYAHREKTEKRSLIENYRNMVVTQLFHVITKPRKNASRRVESRGVGSI